MKKIIVVLCIFLTASASTFSQTQNQVQIPYSVMDNFKQSHPNAFQAMWEPAGSDFRVSYYDESKMQNFKTYDANSRLISHKTEVIGTAIPESISAHYKNQNAADGSYKVWKVIQDGTTTYQVEQNNTVTNFDASGALRK